jgi:hydroxymethylglutaryl-CoA lyase
MNLPKRVIITDVGPRDGLQNEKVNIPTEAKIRLIEGLAAAGLPSIEVTSFVSPKWVPQMADADEVTAKLNYRQGTEYIGLLFNMKGYERARTAGLRTIGIAIAASDTLNRKNMNQGTEEAFESVRPVIEKARVDGVRVRGAVATALGCPYEGQVAPEQVVWCVKKFLELGVDEIGLADTIGAGNPYQLQRLLDKVLGIVPAEKLNVHFHDTRGMGLALALAAAQMGVFRFDGSIAGLGGCPFAPGASGNVASEDLAYMFSEMGVETGINIDLMLEVAREAEKLVGRPLPGHVKGAKLFPSNRPTTAL